MVLFVEPILFVPSNFTELSSVVLRMPPKYIKGSTNIPFAEKIHQIFWLRPTDLRTQEIKISLKV